MVSFLRVENSPTCLGVGPITMRWIPDGYLSAEASTLTFGRPKGFDLKQFDDDGRFGFGEGERVRLSFHIDADAGAHLRETPLSVDQRVDDLGNGQLKITATVVDSAMLEWWLRGFGEAIIDVRRHPVVEL